MNSVLKLVDEQFPYYLTAERKEGLEEALKDFPDNMNYYLNNNSLFESELLQGDAIYGLRIINYDTLEARNVKGVLLSNSCDLDLSNNRDYRLKATFAPLIKLKNYENLLLKNGTSKQKVESKIQAIRHQELTNVFYLPPFCSSEDEYIVLLHDIHSIPIDTIDLEGQNQKAFTLSQAGFYMFLFKISIHFCRFHENIER